MPKKTKKVLAKQFDKHTLYELSVQCAESEIDFVDETYQHLRNKIPSTLREDFCGTANVCKEWVTRRKTNRATGIDFDPEVLKWAHQNTINDLTSAQIKRIKLTEDNVLTVSTKPHDIALAMNFSYWLFADRQILKQYFINVLKGLASDGIMVLDIYGGYDAYREIEEQTEIETDETTFTYVWDQTDFDPISNMLTCSIHFRFEDGSAIENAFTYHWRLWSIPEITELLEEAGFQKTSVYWQGFDSDGEADGIFKIAKRGEAEAGWISYLVAEK